MSANKVILVGRLGRDPELRYTQGGAATASLSLATNRHVPGQNGNPDREITDWHDVVTWGKQAEATAQHTRKGALLYVEGRLQTRSWDGQDGVKRYKTEVVAENIQFLSRGSATPEQEAEREVEAER